MKLLFEKFDRFLASVPGKDLEGKTIVLFGDSQMIGAPKEGRDYAHQARVFGVPKTFNFRKKEGWVRNEHMGSKLESLLRARGANVIRIAKGGTGSRFWNKTLTNRTAEYLKTLKPDQVIISLGENDSWRGGYGRDQKHMTNFFKDNALPLMQKLKSISPNVTWFGPAHRHSSTSGEKGLKVKRGRFETDRHLSEFGKQAGVNYVSMLDWPEREPTFQGLRPKEIRYDKIHYRGPAAQAYADEINRNIAPIKPLDSTLE